MDAQSLLDQIARLQKARSLTRGSAYLARLLVERASDQWTLYLTRSEACEVCNVTNWGSARRSLSKLDDAGLITLHTNNCAYIRFLEPPADADPRAETARDRAETARQEPADLTPRAESARERAETARERADSARLPRDWDQGSGKGREINPLPSPPAVLEGGAGETAETAPNLRDRAQNRRGPTIPPAEQARSVRLLTDPEVGLGEYNALQTAERFGFEAVRAQVFRFVRDRADGKARSAGCIPQRLAQPERFGASITEEDRASPLWARHHTEEETAAMDEDERQRKYDPAYWQE